MGGARWTLRILDGPQLWIWYLNGSLWWGGLGKVLGRIVDFICPLALIPQEVFNDLLCSLRYRVVAQPSAEEKLSSAAIPCDSKKIFEGST